MERLELVSVDFRGESDFAPRERRNRSSFRIVKFYHVLGLLSVRVRHGLVAELRVDGVPTLLLREPASALQTGGDVRGLNCMTLVSLPAGATITAAAEHAAPRTRAYLSMRKL